MDALPEMALILCAVRPVPQAHKCRPVRRILNIRLRATTPIRPKGIQRGSEAMEMKPATVSLANPPVAVPGAMKVAQPVSLLLLGKY